MPFGSAEAFIAPEIQQHLNSGVEVLICPTLPAGQTHDWPYYQKSVSPDLFSWDISRGFLNEILRQPIAVLRSLVVAVEPRSLKLTLRNLAVWPKAVWLSGYAREQMVDHIHAHWIAVPATMAMIAAKLAGLPWSITAHRYDIAQGNLISRKFASAEFVRAIDKPGHDELVAQLQPGQTPPEIIRMGVEVDETSAPTRTGRLDDPRIVIGARLIEKKGHVYLLQAIAKLRSNGLKPKLTIYGDGPLEETLLQISNRLNLNECVFFAGPVSHSELLRQLQGGEFDIAALPSVTASDGDKEGIPVFLMEAMAAGVPVIATPNGGISELIDNTSGSLVPEKNAMSIAHAIQALCEDETLRERKAKAGRVKVSEEFSIAACAARLRRRIAESLPSTSRDLVG